MGALKKITSGFVGSLALFGFANAAMVTVAGHDLMEENFANSVVETTGSVYNFDVSGTGATTANETIGGSAGDGVSCLTDGCSFEVGFGGYLQNKSGNDIILFGLGLSGVPEMFDVEVNGFRLSDLSMTGSGVFEGGFEITYLELDLSSFGVAANDLVHAIEIVVKAGMNPEEFALIASLNDVAVPLPAAVWLFGSALAFGGAAARRKRALKAAKA